jgi:hypothetical protein
MFAADGAKTGGAEPHIAEQSRSWRAAGGERGGCARFLKRHRTRLNATILDRNITHLTVTDPRHCLFGHRLAVLQERSGRGPTFVAVELPDGRKRSIRVTSTDLAPAVITSGELASYPPRISMRTLIPLVQHLSANLKLLAEEVIRDGSTSPSASRCVSTVVTSPRISATSGIAPVAEPVGRGADADRANTCGADEEDATAPRRSRKGDRSC